MRALTRVVSGAPSKGEVLVKKMLLVAAAAAATSYVPAVNAQASSAEISQIRQQLQLLIERVDKLEQENATLKQENESLKSLTEYLRAETKGLRKDSASAAAEVGKVKGADWASKVKLSGDIRYRYEGIHDEQVNAQGIQSAADRYRDRIRARVNLEAKATDSLLVGIGVATTEGGDPRSSNQSLDGAFSRKSLDLDTAYFNWKFAEWGGLVGGKMKQPFVKPGQSVFWDSDVNPEGLALTLDSGIFFASAYNFWLDEVSGSKSARTSDAMMHGLQIGARLPLGASSLLLAAHYYDLSAAKGRTPYYVPSGTTGIPASLANGNTTINLGTSAVPNAVLANDFQVIDVSAEFTTTMGELPLQLWADVAQNRDADDFDTAWGAGVLLGKASNYRTWELGASYQKIEKDSLFGQVVDSDFGGGTTDSKGWIIRAGYAPVKNWTLNATYFLNERNMDVANSVGDRGTDYDRFQLDFNVKF
jgi:hypothetical protein